MRHKRPERKIISLNSAIRKAKGFSDTKEWCAAFTPCEILALVKQLKCIPIDHQEYKVKWALERKRKGQGGLLWFYFYPSKYFLRRKL